MLPAEATVFFELKLALHLFPVLRREIRHVLARAALHLLLCFLWHIIENSQS